MAQNNWWGTADEAEVEAHIFHETDDASLGFVDYLPVLTGDVDIEDLRANKNRLIDNTYPVPADKHFYVTTHQQGDLEIFGPAGKRIYRQPISGKGAEIECKDWAPGVYTIAVSAGNKTELRKIIITR
ncbi:MAG: T9SS type A sorting domain-containing protein [Bacteroidales bacterium]|nr:T9SS type A sorting domain-containing protein [Bacteroidales bacterium]